MKKTNSVLLLMAAVAAVWALFSPATARALTERERGYADGEKAAVERLDGRLKSKWYMIGTFTGPVGTASAYRHRPVETAQKLLPPGKSEDYNKGFIDGFCETIMKRRGMVAAMGFSNWAKMAMNMMMGMAMSSAGLPTGPPAP